MSANILDGKSLANRLGVALQQRAKEVATQLGRPACLAVIVAGYNPASLTYVQKKVEECEKLGIHCIKLGLTPECTQEHIIEIIEMFNKDKKCDGILVQLPLPNGIDPNVVIDTIRTDKDVDGLTTFNAGLLSQQRDGIRPCTPLGVIKLLQYYQIDIKGKEIVVVGDSNLVGRPMALMLQNLGATVTICQKFTVSLPKITQRADILIVAVGKKNLIQAPFVKKDAIVIDIGFNNQDGKIYGDVDFANVQPIASAITPVPGGVGPMTVLSLMENILTLAQNHILPTNSSISK